MGITLPMGKRDRGLRSEASIYLSSQHVKRALCTAAFLPVSFLSRVENGRPLLGPGAPIQA